MGADELDMGTLLARCADEPIHVPEAVQPFGAAVLVDPAGVVRVRSADPGELLGGRAGLGEPLSDALGQEATRRVRAATGPFTSVGPDGRRLDVAVHPAGGGWLVEVEDAGPDDLSADELIDRQRSLWQARTLDQLLDALVGEVRALTGFDRVMAYRFDEEWNGQVVAEAVAADRAPYLGLRYPASDIPPQARALYERNPARLIADVAYVPSVLVHEHPDTTAPLDLSDSGLRSVSPVHLRYLVNMGVAASMSLSLLVDGRLWGLVACHHERGPLRPAPARRRAAAALAELASALLVTVAEAEVLTERVVAAERVGAVRAAVERSADPLEGLSSAGADLSELAGAVGVVVSLDGRLARIGEVPDDVTARRIAGELLAGAAVGDGVAPSEPVAVEELAPSAGGLAGALAVPLGHERSWITWYRPELVTEVRWAGDPHGDEVELDAEGHPRLGPRRSFATFVESIEGRCRPWGTGDRWAATELARQLGASLARRTHDRLQVTHVVQRALLLDESVRAAGFDVAVRYRPAHGDPVGGDWHDVFHLPDGSTAFVVGDTVGHGVEVAGIMAQLRNALRAYLVASADPAEALARLDELVRQLLPGQLATAVVCVVEPTSGRLRMALAGHLAPVRVGADGATPMTSPRAPALGVGVSRRPELYEGSLGPDDALVLFSDGLVERRGHDVVAALEHLASALGEGSSGLLAASELCDRALEAGTQSDDDDVTVVALRRHRTDRD